MTINKRTNKCPSRYLCLSEAKKIIILANMHERAHAKKYLYKIHKALNIRIDRIKRVLDKAFYTKKFMPRINKPWKGPKIVKVFSVAQWKIRDQKLRSNKNKSNFAKKNDEFTFFAKFIENTFNKGIELKTTDGMKKIYPRYSVEAYIDMFKHKYPKLWCPSKSAVYRHLWRYKGTLKRFWFSRLYKKLKVKQARKNFAKKRYNPFSSLPDINSSELGHFQADSIIGKATDKKAIASLIELNSGLVWLNLYNRKAHEFAAKTSSEIKKHKKFKTILVDNGSENSKLDILLDETKIYSCDPYSSWKRAQVENMHRLVRIFWPKGKSMNNLTQEAVKVIERKVNTYYRKRYNKYTDHRHRLTSNI